MFSEQSSQMLADILYNQDVLGQKDIDESLTYAKNTNQDLATVLVEIGKLSEETIAFAISNDMGLPFMEVIPSMIDRERMGIFSPEILWRCRAIPLFQGEEILFVMSNPLDENIRQELLEMLGDSSNVVFAVGTAKSIMEVLRSCFQQTELASLVGVKEITSDDPGVMLFITRHLNDAYMKNAEELEFKPLGQELLVQYRISGKMVQQESVPISFAASLATHFKTMANISINTTEIYQKPFLGNLQGQKTQLRLTLLHTSNGERITIGFANSLDANIVQNISQSGFVQEEIHRILNLPQGLILLSNPNPHEIRKLAHLFLKELSGQQKKIFSIEMGIKQTLNEVVQIDLPRSRFSWENILVEQPDVVYIEGTVSEQFWPYISGSRLLILSIPCVSTTDALCFALRQIPGILLSRILRAIVVFARPELLCSKCCRPSSIPELLLQLEPSLGDISPMEAIGCEECQNTGYKGETYVTDIIWADKVLREFMANSPSRYDIASHLGEFGTSILNQLTTLLQEHKIPLKEIWSWL